MSITYATYSDFALIYNLLPRVNVEEVSSHWLPHGALMVNEFLGRCFAVPFSSNNETAKDLNIHFAYLGILERTRNQDDSGELRQSLQDRIENLCDGNAPMITTSGDPIFADPDTANRFDAWSTTQDFKNTFDMRRAINQRIDPDLIDELWREDW